MIGERVRSQASLPSLAGIAGGYSGPRCRDCYGYPDPSSPRCDCTTTGKRKPGYAKACGHASLRPMPHLCVDCGTDISEKKAGALYCDRCKKIRNGQLAAGPTNHPMRQWRSSKGAPNPHRNQRKEEPVSDTAFVCPECEKAFGSAQARGAHRFRAHGYRVAPPPVAPSAGPEVAAVQSEPSVNATVNEVSTPLVVDSSPVAEGAIEPEDFNADEPVDSSAARIRDLLEEVEALHLSALIRELGHSLVGNADDFLREFVYPLVQAAEEAGAAR